MDLNAIQDEIRGLDACIEQVRVDFKPKFDALHEKFSPYVSTNRYPAAVRQDQRSKYKDEYMRMARAMMNAIQVYSYPKMALQIQVLEHERRVRMSAKEIAA